MLADSGRKTEKTKIGRAAAAVRDGWNKRTKIMKKRSGAKYLVSRSRKALLNLKMFVNCGVDSAANGPLKALTPTWRTPA